MSKDNNEIKRNRCWQFMNCPLEIRKDCFAYDLYVDEECWILNQMIKKKDKSKILNTCRRCPWFLKNYPESDLKKLKLIKEVNTI